MGTKVNYISFLKDLDARLDKYFKQHSKFIYCKKGCSHCCEKGDYPISEIELEYLMQGYLKLNNETKIVIQDNFSKIKKGGNALF